MRTKSLLALLALVSLMAGACGGGGEDRTAGCADAENWVNAVVAASEVDPTSATELGPAVEKVNAAQAAFGSSGPEDVRDAVATLDRIESDTIKVDEQQEREDAHATIGKWVADDCGLTTPAGWTGD